MRNPFNYISLEDKEKRLYDAIDNVYETIERMREKTEADYKRLKKLNLQLGVIHTLQYKKEQEAEEAKQLEIDKHPFYLERWMTPHQVLTRQLNRRVSNPDIDKILPIE